MTQVTLNHQELLLLFATLFACRVLLLFLTQILADQGLEGRPLALTGSLDTNFAIVSTSRCIYVWHGMGIKRLVFGKRMGVRIPTIWPTLLLGAVL